MGFGSRVYEQLVEDKKNRFITLVLALASLAIAAYQVIDPQPPTKTEKPSPPKATSEAPPQPNIGIQQISSGDHSPNIITGPVITNTPIAPDHGASAAPAIPTVPGKH